MGGPTDAVLLHLKSTQGRQLDYVVYLYYRYHTLILVLLLLWTIYIRIHHEHLQLLPYCLAELRHGVEISIAFCTGVSRCSQEIHQP